MCCSFSECLMFQALNRNFQKAIRNASVVQIIGSYQKWSGNWKYI